MKIVAFYSNRNSGIGPTSPAAVNKLSYIIDSMIRCGKNVELLSLCSISAEKKIKKHETFIGNQFVIKYQTCSPKKGVISKIVHKIFDPLKVFFFLSKNIKKRETIYVYHCINYLRIIKHFIKSKELNLILEVEEVYGDVTSNKKIINKERKIFDLANSFIFASELLDEKINVNKRPSSILYGPYTEKPFYNTSFNDNKIHCVYAGTFNETKGGADNAIKSALYLDGKYQMHILGFGNDKEKKRILTLIDEINKKTQCKVFFEGLLIKDDYDKFLQKCSVGLSTQNSVGAFNESSFPSKVLSFMANGLNVVTPKLQVLEESKISRFMNYYECNNPNDIAKVIKSLVIKDSLEEKECIKKLDELFIAELDRILKVYE